MGPWPSHRTLNRPPAAQYRDGDLDAPDGRTVVDGRDLVDVRGGCVGFSQRRNYSVTSYGTGDANLYAVLEGGNTARMKGPRSPQPTRPPTAPPAHPLVQGCPLS